jgi:hypothetical protein
MSQYDAGALPMYQCFTARADSTPYLHLPANVDMDEKNTAGVLSLQSENFDLSAADKIPEKELNEVLWKSIKGAASYPAPKRAAFVAVKKDEDDD